MDSNLVDALASEGRRLREELAQAEGGAAVPSWATQEVPPRRAEKDPSDEGSSSRLPSLDPRGFSTAELQTVLEACRDEGHKLRRELEGALAAGAAAVEASSATARERLKRELDVALEGLKTPGGGLAATAQAAAATEREKLQKELDAMLNQEGCFADAKGAFSSPRRCASTQSLTPEAHERARRRSAAAEDAAGHEGCRDRLQRELDAVLREPKAAGPKRGADSVPVPGGVKPGTARSEPTLLGSPFRWADAPQSPRTQPTRQPKTPFSARGMAGRTASEASWSAPRAPRSPRYSAEQLFGSRDAQADPFDAAMHDYRLDRERLQGKLAELRSMFAAAAKGGQVH